MIVLRRKPGIVDHTCNANILEAETRGTQDAGQPRLVIPRPPKQKETSSYHHQQKVLLFLWSTQLPLICDRTTKHKTSLYWSLMLSWAQTATDRWLIWLKKEHGYRVFIVTSPVTSSSVREGPVMASPSLVLKHFVESLGGVFFWFLS